MVLAALLQPVFAKAKEAAKVQSSVQRLRQLHMAVAIYRADNGLDGYSVNQFPPWPAVYFGLLGLEIDFFRGPCGYKPGISDHLLQTTYRYRPFHEPIIEYYFETYQENMMLWDDQFCNTPEQWNAPFMSKRRLGVLVGGRIVNEMDTGNTTPYSWWIPKFLR